MLRNIRIFILLLISTVGLYAQDIKSPSCTISNGTITCGSSSLSGGPGGANTQLQYNNNGIFGGISGWTTNGIDAITGIGTGSTPVLKLTKTTSDTSAKSALDIHTSTASSGRYLQLFQDDQSSTVPYFYIDDGGNLKSALSILVSGTVGIVSPYTGTVTPKPYMIGCYSDVDAACLVLRPPFRSQVNGRFVDFIGNDNTPNFDLSIFPRGVFGWGTSSSYGNANAFLGPNWAGTAGTLQQGGFDAFAPVTPQHFTVQNAVASSTVAATAVTAAGNATLNFNTTLPFTVFAGQTVTNSTAPTAISGGTTILSIAADRKTAVMSAVAAGPGVSNGDLIVFSSPNIAGVDRYIDGSQGTGTGVGGKIHLTIASAGLTGSTQNTLVDAIIIDPTAASTSVAPVTIALGDNSFRQLAFKPNSGVDTAFGSVNTGSGLLFFLGTAKVLVLDGTGVTYARDNYHSWSNNATIPNTTKDTTLSRLSPGNLQIGTSSNNALGSLNLTNITGTGTISGAALNISSPNVLMPALASDGGATDATVCVKTSDGTILKGSGTLGICLGTSSERFKIEIEPIDVGLKEIIALPSKKFYLDKEHGNPNKLMYGFTAEDCAKILPKLTEFDDKSNPNTCDYLGVVPVLVRAIQQQQTKIEALERRLQ